MIIKTCINRANFYMLCSCVVCVGTVSDEQIAAIHREHDGMFKEDLDSRLRSELGIIYIYILRINKTAQLKLA